LDEAYRGFWRGIVRARYLASSRRGFLRTFANRPLPGGPVHSRKAAISSRLPRRRPGTSIPTTFFRGPRCHCYESRRSLLTMPGLRPRAGLPRASTGRCCAVGPRRGGLCTTRGIGLVTQADGSARILRLGPIVFVPHLKASSRGTTPSRPQSSRTSEGGG